jgi:adenosylcobinamide kinase/adenosylcobinamide-phosphate guanylyltransferase
MAERIAAHVARRGSGWRTVEEPLDLPGVLRREARAENVVLVDCLTLWLTNLMFATREDVPDVGPIVLPPLFGAERAALLAWLDAPPAGDVVFVSNEVGMGIVPYGAVSRAFVDEAGRLHQDVAARCDRVLFVAAGLPLALKGAPC